MKRVYKPTVVSGSRRAAYFKTGQAMRDARIRAARPVRTFAPTSRQSSLIPETKYFDCGFNADVTTAGATWADTEVPMDNYVNSSGVAAAYTDSALIPSAVGSGYGQVNGNRYKLKKIRVRGQVSKVNTAGVTVAASPNFYRIMLVMDTQPNGAQAQGETVIADFGAAAENLYAFKNTSSASGRFRVLKDQMGKLEVTASANNASATTVSSAFAVDQFSFQYKPKVPILVNIASGNATPTVAGLESCNIFLLAAGVDEGGNAIALTVVGCSRAYYCD